MIFDFDLQDAAEGVEELTSEGFTRPRHQTAEEEPVLDPPEDEELDDEIE